MDEGTGLSVANEYSLRRDELHLWEFLLACNNASSEEDFQNTIYPQLKTILPHSAFACLTVRASDCRVNRRYSISVPGNYADSLIGRDGRLVSVAAGRWLKSRRPVFIGGSSRNGEGMDGQPSAAPKRSHDLADGKDVVGHGIASPGRAWVTYFEFAGIEGWTANSSRVIEMAVPHLQSAMTNSHFLAPSDPEVSLSDREKEVLTWICLGKSNSQIAHILDISAWTVKIHVGNILTKLSAANRSHAIVRAIEFGIVDL